MPNRPSSFPSPERRLLEAKLTAPAGSRATVSRAAIIEAICSSRAPRLSLIRAAAGFGKTTAMLECQQRFVAMGMPTAWLALDRADNDASRFLRVLQIAVAPLLGLDEGEPFDIDGADRPSDLGAAVFELLNRLRAHAGPFALFLDDFEVIHEPGVQSLVREVIDALPRQAHLVIGSRSLPELRLGRLRAQGDLLEIDAAQLRFTLQETTSFFAARGNLPLAANDVERLHRKTEGWVAALWLAVLALERSPAPSEFIDRFSGTDRAVADYLAEEVLARQPEGIHQFLLHSSVLKQLEPGICNFVLARSDSAEVLELLEKTNALLVRLGDGKPTYRYHSMFSTFLQEQLAREEPHEVRHLHRRAAQWYLSRERPVPAIDHALESGDTALAIELLEANAGALLAQGRMRILSRWLESLPAGALAPHPELMAVRIWARCFTRGSREATELLEASGLDEGTSPRVAMHLLGLRPLLLAMMDRYEDAYAAGRESLARMPTDIAFSDMVLANAMTTVAAVLGKHHEARRLLDSARRSQGQAGSSFNIMFSEAAEGIIDLQEGRLRQATARFRLAINATAGTGYSHSHGNSWAVVLYACVCYEANELEQAGHLLHVYLPIARDIQLTDQVISGYVLLSRIAFHRGDIDHAFQALTELEYLGHQRQLPRLVASAHLERSRLHLRQGHGAAAREELERADDKALWRQISELRLLANDTEYQALAELRWEAYAGDAAQAARRLGEEADLAHAGARERRALKLNLLRAVALYRDERRAAAFALLHDVLKAACSEGYMRLLLDEGPPAGALLRSYLGASLDRAPDQGDPIFSEYLQRLKRAFAAEHALGEAPPAAAAEPAAPTEPMTRKELRVVRLLAEGYSNNAIAEKLFVSDSTVRTHLRNINSKLGTHSRTQAVAVARRLSLLD
jgi:LuxR family transcriptional regulator, maltose regulon positive regulatory protein